MSCEPFFFFFCTCTDLVSSEEIVSFASSSLTPLIFLYPVRTFVSFPRDLRFPCSFYWFVLLQNRLNSLSPLYDLVANLQCPERWRRPCCCTVDSRFTIAYWKSTTGVFLTLASCSLPTVLWLHNCSLPSLLTFRHVYAEVFW